MNCLWTSDRTGTVIIANSLGRYDSLGISGFVKSDHFCYLLSCFQWHLLLGAGDRGKDITALKCSLSFWMYLADSQRIVSKTAQ